MKTTFNETRARLFLVLAVLILASLFIMSRTGIPTLDAMLSLPRDYIHVGLIAFIFITLIGIIRLKERGQEDED